MFHHIFYSLAWSTYLFIFSISFSLWGPLAQSAGAAEYTDSISAEE